MSKQWILSKTLVVVIAGLVLFAAAGVGFASGPTTALLSDEEGATVAFNVTVPVPGNAQLAADPDQTVSSASVGGTNDASEVESSSAEPIETSSPVPQETNNSNTTPAPTPTPTSTPTPTPEPDPTAEP